MQLAEALMESDNITATIGVVTLLIQRCSSEPFNTYAQHSFIYTVNHATEGMFHGFIYDTTDGLIVDIMERDDDVWIEYDAQIEQADWQPTTERIDLSTCQCRACYTFRRGYGLIDDDVSYDQWRQS